uniref:Large ribosomal subunit protein uL29m n=1 Tax=Lygus hesperus TaxID=30085 RepID=A0A0A9W606_LYGHE
MNKLYRVLGVARNQLASYVPRVNATSQAAAVPTPDPKVSTPVKDKHEGLMEFFDVKENWKLNEVRVGRSWRKEELRIKSNQDLHKLWYVLLKERNMLLSMQHELNEKWEPFPSPERLDKVHESMVNLEEVVRERNRAYHLLETGETGERPGRVEVGKLGMNFFYKTAEHAIPPEYNNHWFKKKNLGCDRREVAKFRLYYNEKIWLTRLKEKNRNTRHVMQLYKRFPDLDEEALQAEYPDVDLERVKRWHGAQGHFMPRNL